MSAADSTAPVEYRPIDGFPGYRIGSDGSVWSCKPLRQGSPSVGWRLMRLQVSIYGYQIVTLRRESGSKTKACHRLVLESFVGPCPVGMECCHGDGNKTNNRVENLRWDTPDANRRDMMRHGTRARGERNGASKLTAEQVQEIKLRRAAGETQMTIAKSYGVSESLISVIELGKGWKHVPAAQSQSSQQGAKE